MIKPQRFKMVSWASLLIFSMIVMRLGYLQIYCHASLVERVEREQERRRGPVEATRGQILDRSGRVLAMSIGGSSCFADPRHVVNPTATAAALSPLLHVQASTLKEKLIEHKRFVWLGRRLDPDATQKIRDLKLNGIHVVTEPKRLYPEQTLAAQLLGVVGENHQGLSGVENVANSWLTGSKMPAFFREWKLARNKQWTPVNNDDPEPYSVVLTIDRTLQYIAEQELAAQMNQAHPKSGTVIIQDAQTGDILAMATAPTFDPNLWGTSLGKEYVPELLKNQAVEKVFEPGSTFKMVTAAAALEDRIVNPTDSFFCENGTWQILGRTIHDHEKDGWLTFTDVIGHSSNIGTAKVALKLGQDRLYRFARAFGFGLPTACGLAGDSSGILRNPSQWRPGSLMTVAFGQEVGVTPIQMVNAFTVVANGGWLVEPRIFKGLVDEDGNYQEWKHTPPIRRVVSERAAQQLRMILKAVVDTGTGKSAAVPGISVAGKTGTAQKIDPRTRQYSDRHYIASFCGFAPADRPRLVIGVFLDEPQGDYYGGSQAAPVFSRIVRNAAAYWQLKSESLGPLAVLKTAPRS